MKEEGKERENQEKESEEKSANRLMEEIDAGEWQSLNRFEIYRKRSRQGKIIATLQALTNRIDQLEKLFYQLVRDHPQKATKLLAEIKKLRLLKEFLLQCLIWEERGELEDHEMPEELEELI